MAVSGNIYGNFWPKNPNRGNFWEFLGVLWEFYGSAFNMAAPAS